MKFSAAPAEKKTSSEAEAAVGGFFHLGDPLREDEGRLREKAASLESLGKMSKWGSLGFACACALAVAGGDPLWFRALLLALWFAGHASADWHRRRGSIAGATSSLGAAGWLVASCLQWSSGGLSSPALGLAVVVVFTGGLVGGPKAARLLGGLTVANLLAMAGWAWSGRRAFEIAELTAWASFADEALIVGMAGVGVSLSLSRLRRAGGEAKAREAKAREIVHGFTDLFVKSPAPMALCAWGSLSAPGLGSGMAVNEAFEMLFGIAREEALKRPWNTAPMWREDGSLSLARKTLAESGNVAMLRVGFRHESSGEQIWCAVSARPVVWEGVNALLWTYQDITKQEELLMDLEGFNCELEARVEGKAIELDRARKELRRRERLANLGELVAGVAHEINTPIGNALLSASTMSEPAMRLAEMAKGSGLSRAELASVSKKLSDASELAMVNLKKASEIIGNFKQLSADQAGESRRAYTIYDVAAGALKAMGTAMKRKGVAWRVSGAAGAETDEMDGYPGALSQIVGIIASNALAHAYGEEEVWETDRLFEVFVERAGEGWMKISFMDNGVGMGAGLAARVFEPFFTTKAGRGGTGLGLAIAWNLSRDALGGELVVTEHDRPGSRFDLLMPRKAPDAQSTGKGGKSEVD